MDPPSNFFRNKTVAVTGGLGFVGRDLVRQLNGLARRIAVIDDASTGSRLSLPRGVRLRRVDLRDSRLIAPAIEGVDIVFHLAGNSSVPLSVRDPKHDFECNAIATLNLADALLGSAVQRLVYVSSAEVYGRSQVIPIQEQHPTQPLVPYGASKLAGETICASFCSAFGLPTVIVRPFTLYGPGESRTPCSDVLSYVRAVLSRVPVSVPADLEASKHDFLHVSDFSLALLFVATHGVTGDIVNVGSGEGVTRAELLDLIGDLTGITPMVTQVESTSPDRWNRVADVSRLRGLGFCPRFSLRAGLAAVIQHVRTEAPRLRQGPEGL